MPSSINVKCRHGNILCSQCIVADDVAKRAFEQVRNIAVHNDWDTRINSWVTIRLSDGYCDGNLYDTKKDAVRHCKGKEQWYAFFAFRNSPNGFQSPRDAAIFLGYARMAYEQGFRLPDPDDNSGGPDLIMPTPKEHVLLQLQELMRKAVN